MILDQLSFVPIIVIILFSLQQVASQNWKRNIIALAIQYFAVFLLIGQLWPLGQAAVKLVTGWMVCSLLGSSQPIEELVTYPDFNIFARLFRILAIILVGIFVYAINPLISHWFPANSMILLGGTMLFGFGLFNLGVNVKPLKIIIGLLTTLSGFEVLYASIEASVLVTGLLAIVNLGLALVGSYIVSSVAMERDQ
jgi:hypothetical protein